MELFSEDFPSSGWNRAKEEKGADDKGPSQLSLELALTSQKVPNAWYSP